MNSPPTPSSGPIHTTKGAFATLRKFARQRPPNVERCELCSLDLATEHDHLVEPRSRKLLCACPACALLFCGQADTKYRRVPRDTKLLRNFQISDSEWDGLTIPINMAFFFYSSPDERMVAMYPSPAGPVESLLSMETWKELIQNHSSLKHLQPDVEALLVNRLGDRRGFTEDEYYIAPIDQCYKLVGLLRMRWRGLSGGTEVWEAMSQYFEELRKNAREVREVQDA